MSPKRELAVTYHAVSRYLERVEHREPPRVVYAPVYNRIRPKILEIVEQGRLLDARECALFVRMAANLVSGTRRAPHAPAHWGHYYYDEAKGVIAVVNHDQAITTVIVPDDLQLEHLQRFKKRMDPVRREVSEALERVQVKEFLGTEFEICVCEGSTPSEETLNAWINNHGADMSIIWMDAITATKYQTKGQVHHLPDLGPSISNPNTDAIWIMREFTDREILAPRRIACRAAWAMFMLLCLLGRETVIPQEGIAFEPSTVYALSFDKFTPSLARVYKI